MTPQEEGSAIPFWCSSGADCAGSVRPSELTVDQWRGRDWSHPKVFTCVWFSKKDTQSWNSLLLAAWTWGISRWWHLSTLQCPCLPEMCQCGNIKGENDLTFWFLCNLLNNVLKLDVGVFHRPVKSSTLPWRVTWFTVFYGREPLNAATLWKMQMIRSCCLRLLSSDPAENTSMGCCC